MEHEFKLSSLSLSHTRTTPRRDCFKAYGHQSMQWIGDREEKLPEQKELNTSGHYKTPSESIIFSQKVFDKQVGAGHCRSEGQ